MCGWAQNLIFRFLQSRQKVQIWLFEQTDLRIEGRIIVRLSHISWLHSWKKARASTWCILKCSAAVFSLCRGLTSI